MKHLKHFLAFLFLVFLLSSCGNVEKAQVQTNAVCKTCEAILDENLTQEAGITAVALNLETKVLTVEYNPEAISMAEIETLVSKTGYDANDVKADAEAHSKLPYCCQIENQVPANDDQHKKTFEEVKK